MPTVLYIYCWHFICNIMNEIIKTRRSIFPAQYIEGAIEKQDLLSILDAARWAPNHRKTEPWRYKVLTGKALDRLGTYLGNAYEETPGHKKIKLKKLRENPSKAAAVILIFMHRDEKESVPEWEEVAATSMSVQNMWLMTHELGYGAYWSSPKSFVDMKNFEGITTHENERFLGFFYIGNYDKKGFDYNATRKTIEEIATFIDM